jgi:hypothetical protein
MSQLKSSKITSRIGWAISALLIVGSAWLWINRQYIVDAIQYSQYKPTEAVSQIARADGFTNDARFVFYATRPSVESSTEFNQHCQRKEANSPILGCYAEGRIYIFDVSDSRLQGVKPVTAAHEMLHAEYDRLPLSEKKRLQPLLQSVYDRVADDGLKERMEYYQKTEPGEAFNELHSIIGTEVTDVGPQLEAYYRKYFKDRQSLVRLHAQVDNTFNTLSEEADDLVNQIEKLATTINNQTREYNDRIATLSQSVNAFNSRATQPGGFTTQSQFESARQQLVYQSSQLGDFRQTIEANVAKYKTLLARLDSINAESASLNESLDSTLSDAPKI